MLRPSPTSPFEFSQKKGVITDCGAQGPMSLQDAADCHGHEMHPQEFVRLVGCHDSKPASHEGVHRLH
jgi:hypothetical protein